MTNIDQKKAPVSGEDDREHKHADESPALPRDASRTPDIEEPEETFDQPAPKRQSDHDAEDDPNTRKADADFEDLDIEVDESEVEAERQGQPQSRN